MFSVFEALSAPGTVLQRTNHTNGASAVLRKNQHPRTWIIGW